MISFTIPGDPVTQGSVAPGQRKNGRLYTRHDNRAPLLQWRKTARYYMIQARRSATTKRFRKGCPVAVRALFVCHEPAKPTNEYPAKDLDKFQRALGDAIAGVLIDDDSQIVRWEVQKVYGSNPRTEVTVCAAAEGERDG